MTSSALRCDTGVFRALTALAHGDYPSLDLRYIPSLDRWILRLYSLDHDSGPMAMLQILLRAYGPRPGFTYLDPEEGADPGLIMRYVCAEGRIHQRPVVPGCALVLGGTHIGYIDHAYMHLLDTRSATC